MKSEDLRKIDAEANINDKSNEHEAKIAELSSTISTLNKTIDELKQQALRDAADRVNAEQRNLKRLEQERKFSTQSFAKELLPVIDAMKLAQANIDEKSEMGKGLEMALATFFKTLEKNGITAIATTEQAFDPELHIAVKMEKSEQHKPNMIIATLQDGYMIHERVLRPASVVVSN